jgi:hypothetical protein
MISCKSGAIDIAMLLEENGKAQNSNPRYQCMLKTTALSRYNGKYNSVYKMRSAAKDKSIKHMNTLLNILSSYF